jgi:hypothetical protein
VRRPRALPAVVLLAACQTGFERPSIVIDLRVLAMRTDPAEVVVDFDPRQPELPDVPPVTVTTLVADPLGPRPLAYTMTACPEQFRRRCAPELPSFRFAEGTTTGAPEAVLQADARLLAAALEYDDFLGLGGVPVQIVMTLRPVDAPESETLHAAKLIFYAPRVPEDRQPNRNPVIAQLLADDEPLAEETPLVVAPGAEVRLEPVEPEGVRESYVVPTLDGDVRRFTENIRYSWLATAGRFSDERTGGPTDAFGNVPLLRTRWRAPEIPGPVTLWVVQRDERGGTSWIQRTLEVR